MLKRPKLLDGLGEEISKGELRGEGDGEQGQLVHICFWLQVTE